jgi:hypothetical protein
MAIALSISGRNRSVQPLGFVNWRTVNRYFCALMWLVAVVLALVVLTHLVSATPAAHGPGAVMVR